MRNKNVTALILLCFVFCSLFSGCGMFSRIVEIHKTDTIKIAAPLVRDTLLFFKEKSDTIKTEFTTIYRYGDTLRLHYIERPCTTYISKTEIRPTSHTKETRREGPIYPKLTFWDKMILILSLFVIFVVLLNRFLNAGNRRPE